METNKIKPLVIEVDKELWERFKFLTPRNITLNDKVVELIQQEVDSH